MSEAPKRVWMVFDDDGCGGIDSYQAPKNFGSEYIRADLVDGLAEAVEKVLRISDRNHDAWYAARAALAALKEEG